MDISQILQQHNIPLDVSKDQHFVVDESVLNRIIDIAGLNKGDTVLEVGAGMGNLTLKLAEKSKRVIAFEIDERFRVFHQSLPENVEMHYVDAWDYVQLHGKFWKKKEYNKIVSNLPYSFTEQFLHNLTFLMYDKAILMIPQSMINKIAKHGIFSSFFVVKPMFAVPPVSFYPVPKTESVVIDLQKFPDAIASNNLSLFLRQYIYQHEDQKVKNSIREGIIEFVKLKHNRILTKNQVRKIIDGINLSDESLSHGPSDMSIYFKISEIFDSFII